MRCLMRCSGTSAAEAAGVRYQDSDTTVTMNDTAEVLLAVALVCCIACTVSGRAAQYGNDYDDADDGTLTLRYATRHSHKSTGTRSEVNS